MLQNSNVGLDSLALPFAMNLTFVLYLLRNPDREVSKQFRFGVTQEPL